LPLHVAAQGPALRRATSDALPHKQNRRGVTAAAALLS